MRLAVVILLAAQGKLPPLEPAVPWVLEWRMFHRSLFIVVCYRRRSQVCFVSSSPATTRPALGLWFGEERSHTFQAHVVAIPRDRAAVGQRFGDSGQLPLVDQRSHVSPIAADEGCGFFDGHPVSLATLLFAKSCRVCRRSTVAKQKERRNPDCSGSPRQRVRENSTRPSAPLRSAEPSCCFSRSGALRPSLAIFPQADA